MVLNELSLVFVVFSYRDSLIHSSVGGKKIDAWARLIFPGDRCLDGCFEGMEGNVDEVFDSKVPVVFSFVGVEEIAPATTTNKIKKVANIDKKEGWGTICFSYVWQCILCCCLGVEN